MKITETIERECCLQRDLRPYRGKINKSLQISKPQFCIHCGQIWLAVRQMDVAGGSETVLEAMFVDEGQPEQTRR